MINTEVEDFFSLLNSKMGKTDISTALKTFYTTKVASGLSNAMSSGLDVLPVLIYKTHVSTLVNGIPKSISVSDFKSIIHSLSGSEGEDIPPISLPFGCFMFNRTESSLLLNCYYRETIIDLTFNDRDSKKIKYKVPMPNVIISFSLKKIENGVWQINQVKYFSTPKTVSQLPDDKFIQNLDAHTGVYRLPFPNMYGDCRMCYGSNSMPMRFNNNLRGLDYYYQILTQTPFN